MGLYMDLRYRRLPNWLTVPVIVVGIAIRSIGAVWFGALDAIGGVLFAFVLILPFLQGGLGGGDLKFLAAMGALKGFYFVLWAALFGAVLGGLVSVVILIRQGRFKYELWRCFLSFRNLEVARKERPDLKPRRTQASLFPYGVVLVFGAIIQRLAGF
jgi:prepilin peptidase CpaA